MIGDEEDPAYVAIPGPPSLKDPSDEMVDFIMNPDSINIVYPTIGTNRGVANNEDETNQQEGSKDGFVDYEDEEGNNPDDDAKDNLTSQETDRSAVDFPFFSIMVILFFGLAVIGGIKALEREAAIWIRLQSLDYIRYFGGYYYDNSFRSVPLFAWVYGALLISIIILVCAIKDCCCGKLSNQKEDSNSIAQPEGFEAIGEKVTATRLGKNEEVAAGKSSPNFGIVKKSDLTTEEADGTMFPSKRAVETSRRSCCREVGTVFLLLCIGTLQLFCVWFDKVVWFKTVWSSIGGFVVSIMVTLFLRWKMVRNNRNPPSPNEPNCTLAFRTSYWLSVWLFISCSFFGAGAIALDQYFFSYSYNVDVIFVYSGGVFLSSIIVFMIRIVKWRKAITCAKSDAVDEKNNNENTQDNGVEYNKNICNPSNSNHEEGVFGDKSRDVKRSGANENSNDTSQSSIISDNNMVCISDLCILLVGSGLGCPICTLITTYDTRDIMVVFLAVVILPSTLWHLLKYLRARVSNSPSSMTGSTSEIKKSKPQNFPEDTYSFLAVYSWKHKNNLFSFGLTVFLFQASLLAFMILSALFPRFRTGEIDNPDSEDKFMGFFPTNANALVRATQCVSILAFSLFPQASLLDITNAITLFPRGNLQGEKELQGLALSCILRFVQGILSVFAVFLLVMTSSEVSEVVLNFTAVNFISEMDEIGFQLAESGYYGRALRDATNHVKTKKIPRSHDKRMHCGIGQAYSNAAVALFLLILTACTIFSQETTNQWTTDVVRVQFASENGSSSEYNGCYLLDPSKPNGKWHIYGSHVANKSPATIGYCRDERRWFLYRGDTNDPCAAFDGGLEIARSPKSDFFDIESSTEEQWLDPVNIPIGLSFITHVDNLEESCDSFLGDFNGKCDAAFNFAAYNYDDGDCCAYSCRNSENCGKGAAGYGDDEILYPDCFQRKGADTTVKIIFDIALSTTDWNHYDKYGNFTLANPIIFACDGETDFRIKTVNNLRDPRSFELSSVVPFQSKCSLSTTAKGVNNYRVYLPYFESYGNHNSDRKGGFNFGNEIPDAEGEKIFEGAFTSDDPELFEIISKINTPYPTNSPTRNPTKKPTMPPSIRPTSNPTRPSRIQPDSA